MLDAIKELTNLTYTENGALTYHSTLDHGLDLFSSIGAMRQQDDSRIIARFNRAYAQDPDLAMKILFYARDVRGGLGERHVFRVILKHLAWSNPASVRKNLEQIAEFGRWDDLLCLLTTPCQRQMLELVKQQLERDMAALENDAPVSLLGKWLPSVNASSQKTVAAAKQIAKALGLSIPAYRRLLTALRRQIRIIENDLREKNYTFDYAKQPSGAMFKYRKAFIRHDGSRYMQYLHDVSEGKASLHTDTLMPYELVRPYLSDNNFTRSNPSFLRTLSPAETQVLNTTWNALPAFPMEENALAVIDTSGSMYMDYSPMPAAVALSLGLYFAEHNKGAFANCFIEFSQRPQLIELKGSTFAEKLAYAASFNQVANTDISKVFDLLLEAAIKKRASQAELPKTLYIISDMEFDACVDGADETNFERAKQKFAVHGYNLPRIVFWNVASRTQQMPVTKNEQGVALVSGCTPRIFSMVTADQLDPVQYMHAVLSDPRYEMICA